MMDFWSVFGKIADGVSILAAIVAFIGWWQVSRLNRQFNKERARQAQLIHVVLQNRDAPQQLTLPIAMRRSEVTRSEVLGLIGMARKGGGRYDLAYISRAAFGEDMERIKASATENTLVIPCSNGEFQQFDVMP